MIKNILLFLFLLLGIVIVHEFGHLLAAKFFNVYCSEFSIGMGPLLYRHKGKETDLTVRLFPIGGFVAIAGDSENELESTVDVQVPFERTMKGIARWKRCIIMLAGVMMNFILALLIIVGIMLYNGHIYNSPEAIIQEVLLSSPAEAADLKVGDKITNVTLPNGQTYEIADINDFSSCLTLYSGEEGVLLKVARDGDTLEIRVFPEYLSDENRYYVGFKTGEYQLVDVNLLNVWGMAAAYLWDIACMIAVTFLGLFRGIGFENLSGPVGIYQATSEAASAGSMTYLTLIAVISLNIGIFNLLPLPIMDGGRVVLLLIEGLIGKPLNKKIETAIMNISVILLLLLLIFATSQDFLRLFS